MLQRLNRCCEESGMRINVKKTKAMVIEKNPRNVDIRIENDRIQVERFRYLGSIMSAVPAIGIDLGTTYSVVGVYQHGKVEIIANEFGNRLTPSIVAFNNYEGEIVGEAAVNQAPLNVANTIFDVKRFIGRRFEEPIVQEDMNLWPFEVVNKDGKPCIRIKYHGEEKVYLPEEISALVLRKMKEIAENYVGKTVTKAVITVPAYFNNSQRQATMDAGKIAGLTVDKIISEPVAGALAYGLQKCIQNGNILVFDLGGGTFDISVLTLKKGTYEVRVTGGNTHLGGRDFDNRMVTYFVNEFKQKRRRDLTADKKAMIKLLNACEKAKRVLSTRSEASINIDALFKGMDFSSSITRAKFEDITKDLFEQLMEQVKTTLNDANMRAEEIDELVLIGGATRMPKLQNDLQNLFNGKELKKDINPDEAVAYGATIKAAMENGDSNVDIQALVLREVTPLSLGIEIKGGLMLVVVERNTPIPTEKSKMVLTTQDNQRSVGILIYEGERDITTGNHLLGKLYLSELPPAPAGDVKIDITFKIDENGILKVTATERSTGTTNNIRIDSYKGNLSEQEIQHLIQQGYVHGEDDRKERLRIEARNSLDSYCLEMKRKARDKVLNKSDLHNKMIIDACNEIQQWLKSNGHVSREAYQSQKKKLEEICNSE